MYIEFSSCPVPGLLKLASVHSSPVDMRLVAIERRPIGVLHKRRRRSPETRAILGFQRIGVGIRVSQPPGPAAAAAKGAPRDTALQMR